MGAALPVTILFILILPMACNRNNTAEQADCDLAAGACVKTVGADHPVQVTLDIEPRPLATMKRLVFTVGVAGTAGEMNNAEVFIDLTMPGMSMMENRIHLRRTQDGRYAGEGVIVKCSSGRKIWKADVTIDRHGAAASGSMHTSFQFRVGR